MTDVRGTIGREDEAELRTANWQTCQLHFRVMNLLDIERLKPKALKSDIPPQKKISAEILNR